MRLMGYFPEASITIRYNKIGRKLLIFPCMLANRYINENYIQEYQRFKQSVIVLTIFWHAPVKRYNTRAPNAARVKNRDVINIISGRDVQFTDEDRRRNY